MRITVVGAILIVAIVTASVLVLLAMSGRNSERNNKQNDASPPDYAV